MKIAAAWLDHAETQALCKALADAGFQALFVGGCVRNAILGVAVADIDLATDARPDVVMGIARGLGFGVVPTGIDHGTVTVLAGDRAVEVTTFRRDVSTDGRRATVAFADDVVEDARRRDLTMNALYADADGRIVDPLGGLPDILARRVRFVGEAGARIAEDYLRILRFFRFHALYADAALGLDSEGLAACAAGVDGLAQLSRERVTDEMRKMLSAPDPAPVLAAMQASGVLARVLPGADARFVAVLVHVEQDIAPRWQRRLAVLGGDLAGLRLSKEEAREVQAVVEGIGSTQTIAAIAWLHGADVARDVALTRAVVFEAVPAPDWRDQVARGISAKFPVSSFDLAPLEGPALGKKLKQLQARWLQSDLMLSKDDLIR
jgi:poly(A) polymerase